MIATVNQCSIIVGLLDAGANVHIQDSDGVTALHAAVMHGHTTVARTLVVHGADAGIYMKMTGKALD